MGRSSSRPVQRPIVARLRLQKPTRGYASDHSLAATLSEVKTLVARVGKAAILRGFSVILLSFGLLLANACADSTSGAGGDAGMGGSAGTGAAGGAGASGGGGSGGDDCQSVESACQVLGEPECTQREECFAVEGALW